MGGELACCPYGTYTHSREMSHPEKILLIKPSSIGDVVHTLPLWNLLRLAYPEAEISWLIAPACEGIVAGLPGIRLLRFERKLWGSAWYNLSAAANLLRFMSGLRRQQFDLVIDVQGLFRSGYFTFQSRAPMRIGFANAREFAPLFYTHRVEYGPLEQHAVDRYLRLLGALGIAQHPVEFPLPIQPVHRQAAQRLAPAGRFAVLCPGANWLTKRWPAQRFAGLVKPLQERFGLSSIVVGGPGDGELAAQIPGASDLTGKTSLMELAALMESASLVITNDSGPMHIAAALHRPMVAIFGPTNPVRTGPYGHMDAVIRANTDCSPCYKRQCPRQHECMLYMEPARIIERVAAVLTPRPSADTGAASSSCTGGSGG